jgi:hypothetical protein
MVIVYMVVICVSALLAAWAGTRLLRRIGPLVGLQSGAGWCAAVPALGFLMVIGAPAPVLVAALLLGVMMQLAPQRLGTIVPQFLLMIAAVLIGLIGLPSIAAPYLTALPHPLLLAAAGVLWLGVLLSVTYSTDIVTSFSGATLAALAAVATAPLLVSGAGSIAFDAAIIACSLFGIFMARGTALPIGLAPRLVLGLLIGYLQISALWHGAWIAAIASLALWLGGIGWSWVASDPWERHHA